MSWLIHSLIAKKFTFHQAVSRCSEVADRQLRYCVLSRKRRGHAVLKSRLTKELGRATRVDLTYIYIYDLPHFSCIREICSILDEAGEAIVFVERPPSPC